MGPIESKRERERLRRREKRAEAKLAGVKLPGDDWAMRNKERHRENVARWRAENVDSAREIGRNSQKRRRSTPWGAINNRVWSVMHGAVRRASNRKSKYTEALGYLWSDLAKHLGKNFTSDMSWDNWGDYWELDHIKPVSEFKYESLDDPLFRQAWALSNLRPLKKEENAAKGCKSLEFT